MKAIVVTNQAAGTAGMNLVERPEPQAAINDVVVQVLRRDSPRVS
jgi:NADPH:quinone reductase-like Zn-dependent oxidoreductase